MDILVLAFELRYAMIILICINYKWLLSVDQAFCESYTCYASLSHALIYFQGHLPGLCLDNKVSAISWP